MKSRKSVFYMLLIAGAVLMVGLTVAYYNTASLGYDNANILTVNNESIRIFDITIIFEDYIELFKRVMSFLNFESIAF